MYTHTRMCTRTHTHMHVHAHTHTHTHRCARPKALSPALTLSIGTCTYYCNVPYTITYTHLFCCTSFCMCTHAQMYTHTSLFPRLLPAFHCCIQIASLQHLKSWEEHGDDATHVCCALLCAFVMPLTH